MQCVILAAGKGTRMRPLTDTIPKPLIPVAGKPILDHIIDALPAVIDEIVLIIGYRGEQIIAHCGDLYKGKKIVYRTQENFAGGTGEALLKARDVLHGKFLFMYGDDIHGPEALKKATECEHAILATHSETPERYGVVVRNDDGTLKEIIEKPEHPTSNLINIGGFIINDSIFGFHVPVSASGELYVTDMLSKYAEENPVQVIVQDVWLPIGYPEDIPKAEEVLKKRVE